MRQRDSTGARKRKYKCDTRIFGDPDVPIGRTEAHRNIGVFDLIRRRQRFSAKDLAKNAESVHDYGYVQLEHSWTAETENMTDGQ